MTSQGEPVRQPASDLVAFDVSKRSPEQIAQLFARWKDQRKRLQQKQEPAREPARAGRPSHLRPVPAIVRGPAQGSRSASEDPPSDRSPAGRADSVRYSASFSALLAAGGEPRAAQRVWNPQEGLPKLGRVYPPTRRSKMAWALAGAASAIAVTAVAAGALWQQSSSPPDLRASSDSKPAVDSALVASPPEAEPDAAPLYLDIATAEPFFAIATASPEAEEWPLKQTIDLALMKAAPVDATAQFALMPRLKPPVPKVQESALQTASENAAASKRVTGAPTELGPKLDGVAPMRASVAVAPVAGAEAEAEPEERRRAGLVGRDNDKDNFGATDRTAAASGKASGPAGSGGTADPGSGGTGTGGTGDPGSGSGGSGGSGSGGGSSGGGSGGGPSGGSGGGGSGGSGGGGSSGGNPGGGSGGGNSGGDSGGSDPGGGDTGGGDAGGGDSDGGDSGGGDSSGGNTGGDGSDGGDSGGGDAGGDSDGGDSGGDSDGGDSDGGDSDGGESGESGGIGGAIGGAVGGIGDALGGGLGGEGGDDGKDNDKDKSD